MLDKINELKLEEVNLDSKKFNDLLNELEEEFASGCGAINVCGGCKLVN